MTRLDTMLSISLDIPQLVMEQAEQRAESNRKSIGFLQAVENDILLRVFTFRKHKGKALEITEVMRRMTQEKRFIYKNLYGGGMQGYQAVYKEKDIIHKWRGYPITVFSKEDFDVWCKCEDKPFGIYHTIVNADMLKDTPFKYCGYTPSVTDDVIGYLNEYIEHPNVEFFGKLGIKPSPALISKAEKDKAFRNWLYKTKIDIFCGPQAIIYAYEHNVSIAEAKKICRETARLYKEVARRVPEIKGTKLDRQKVLDYIKSHKIHDSSYSDYLKALKFLKCDLTDTKNVFPHDFQRWHDIRADEYATAKAIMDEKERKELYEKFARVANKYLPMQNTENGAYVVYIAQSPAELIREGEMLNHCVGRMGYDQKFAREESLIFFVRSATDTEKPLVTVEFSIKRKVILQCYAYHDSTPDQAVTDYVNNVWLPTAKKALKKIAA